MTQPFCGGCSRARLSAEGSLYTCLFALRGHDLRAPLRAGATDEELAETLRAHLDAPHRPLLRAPHGRDGVAAEGRDVLHRRLERRRLLVFMRRPETVERKGMRGKTHHRRSYALAILRRARPRGRRSSLGRRRRRRSSRPGRSSVCTDATYPPEESSRGLDEAGRLGHRHRHGGRRRRWASRPASRTRLRRDHRRAARRRSATPSSAG